MGRMLAVAPIAHAAVAMLAVDEWFEALTRAGGHGVAAKANERRLVSGAIVLLGGGCGHGGELVPGGKRIEFSKRALCDGGPWVEFCNSDGDVVGVVRSR